MTCAERLILAAIIISIDLLLLWPGNRDQGNKKGRR